MGITNSNKVLSTGQIDCGETLKVTLALTAAPDILSNPVDIALVLDRSGSMAGAPLANMKAGAKTFIDIIAESTGGQPTGEIGAGSRIGIVSFADTAVQDTQLITSVADLKGAVDALSAGGSTNHAEAFEQAASLFDPSSSNARVIVMFTDGNTTTGVPPAPVAAAARAQGITIYCIGLIGSDGVDVSALNDWATDPDAAHISKTGATNIVIHEVVTADFVITSITPPGQGSAMQLDDTSLRWTIPALGVSASESATLEFFVRHVGNTPGARLVNESISYTDTEGNQVTFPEPTVTVECDVVVQPEECPIPVDLTVRGCQDLVVVNLGDVFLESQGRILQLDLTLKQVCPGKRVALAVILTEVDDNGQEHARGMKTVTIPAHDFPNCRDVLVKCIKFVVPEDLDGTGGNTRPVCEPRSFRARVIAHNIDSDFCCCCGPIVTV